MNKMKKIGLSILSFLVLPLVRAESKYIPDFMNDFIDWIFNKLPEAAKNGELSAIIFFKVLIFFFVFAVMFHSLKKVFGSKYGGGDKRLSTVVALVLSFTSVLLIPNSIMMFILQTFSVALLIFPLGIAFWLFRKMPKNGPIRVMRPFTLLLLGIVLLTFGPYLIGYASDVGFSKADVYASSGEWLSIAGGAIIIMGLIAVSGPKTPNTQRRFDRFKAEKRAKRLAKKEKKDLKKAHKLENKGLKYIYKTISDIRKIIDMLKVGVSDNSRQKLIDNLNTLKDDEKVMRECEDEWTRINGEIQQLENAENHEVMTVYSELRTLGDTRNLGTGGGALTGSDKSKIFNFAQRLVQFVRYEIQINKAAENLLKNVIRPIERQFLDELGLAWNSLGGNDIGTAIQQFKQCIKIKEQQIGHYKIILEYERRRNRLLKHKLRTMNNIKLMEDVIRHELGTLSKRKQLRRREIRNLTK